MTNEIKPSYGVECAKLVYAIIPKGLIIFHDAANSIKIRLEIRLRNHVGYKVRTDLCSKL